jgi:hypothetical protein
MSGDWWAFIFLMLIMKVPIVYLGAVIWWAVQEPKPADGAAKLAEVPEPWHPRRPWRLRLRARRPGPHGSPVRRPAAAERAARAYASKAK